MFLGRVEQTRTRIIRSHEPWKPWKYQERAVQHLMARGSAALFLDPGLGKTAITLEAFRRLRAAGQVRRMLVVAPLRVCQLVWEQEGRKWTQFRDFTFTLLHGPKKEERLREQTDIHLINPEGIAWFSQQFYGRTDLPYDIVTIDELTKFKNQRAQRSKKLRIKLGQVRYRWGLTGSPAPNGYMDLFGQMLILDDGASLGRFISYFRDQYFDRDWNGFDYKLRSGSAEKIEARIAPYVLRMASVDYLDLPPLVDHEIHIDMPPEAVRRYEEMKKDMLLELPDGVVTAANAAATYSKLKQMANGAVYLSEKPGEWAALHDAKLDALEELIEELAGQPVIVAYEFRHDLARLLERLGADTPTLSGIPERKVREVEAAWNNREISVLLVHPASAGHGLNLQGGGAGHICWFSRPWDLEQYDQTIRRIYRQGSTAQRVINHTLIVRGTMDEIVAEALTEKDTTQKRLLAALNAEIAGEDPVPTPRGATQEVAMVKKLGFRAQSGTEEPPPPARPKGWGSPPDEGTVPPPAKQPAQPAAAQNNDEPKRPRGWGPPAGAEPDEQRAEIRRKLRAQPPEADDEEEEEPASVRALQAFPPDVVQQFTGKEQVDVPQPAEPPAESAGWGMVSTRTRNALQAQGIATPREAYGYGKDDLIANVPGFGEKGWKELEELCGGESGDDAPASAPAGVLTTAGVPAAALTADNVVGSSRAPLAGASPAAYAQKLDGANPETLAQLFATIAELLRGR